MALVGATALVAAALDRRRGSKRSTVAWILVATAGTYLSIDEAAGLHERLGRLTNSGGIDPPTYAWVIPGSLFAAVGAAALVVAGRALPSPTGPRLGVALLTYGIGAVGLEAVGGWVRDHGGLDWLFTMVITAEESFEMGAAAYAVITIVDSYDIRRVEDGICLRGSVPPSSEQRWPPRAGTTG